MIALKKITYRAYYYIISQPLYMRYCITLSSIGVLICLWAAIGYAPLLGLIKRYSQHIHTLSVEQEAYQSVKRAYESTQERYAAFEKQWKQQLACRSMRDVCQAFSWISGCLERNHVTVCEYTPSCPEIKNGYSKIALTWLLQGSFEAFIGFFSCLAASPRYISCSECRLYKHTDTMLRCTCTLILLIFASPDALEKEIREQNTHTNFYG